MLRGLVWLLLGAQAAEAFVGGALLCTAHMPRRVLASVPAARRVLGLRYVCFISSDGLFPLAHRDTASFLIEDGLYPQRSD